MKHCNLLARIGRVQALKKALLLGWMLTGAAFWASLPLRAQVVADGATSTLANITNTITSGETVFAGRLTTLRFNGDGHYAFGN